MATPKIKVYQLPTGYSEAGDNDIQQSTNDELIGVEDKPLVPEDWPQLTGVKWIASEDLIPINYASGVQESVLIPNSTAEQTVTSGHTDILTSPSGTSFVPAIFSASGVQIAASGYSLTPSGAIFSSAYPSGAYMRYWRQGTESTTTYAGYQDDWYDGGNMMFSVIIYDSSDEVMDQSTYTTTPASGMLTLSSPASGVSADYTYEAETTKYFIGERENWIFGHLYLNPDVFKGTYDYPGDDSEDLSGNPIIQGAVPQFVEDSEYQIDFRRGLITFPSEFNSTTYPVYAAYSPLVNVRNVTGQTLTQVSAASGGYVYQAIGDKVFPGSLYSKWINRDDSYTPRNFYVDGVLKPQIVTITPYDALSVKLSA